MAVLSMNQNFERKLLCKAVLITALFCMSHDDSVYEQTYPPTIYYHKSASHRVEIPIHKFWVDVLKHM